MGGTQSAAWPGQGRGNSGILINNMYEVQVLDSYNAKTYPDGQAGAIYGQSPPLVNACKPPGGRQTDDIIFESPRWNAQGELTEKGHYYGAAQRGRCSEPLRVDRHDRGINAAQPWRTYFQIPSRTPRRSLLSCRTTTTLFVFAISGCGESGRGLAVG